MAPPLNNANLTQWARRALVYEGRMLAFTAIRTAERQGIPRDPESNALLESFLLHVRCLRDFLWGRRNRHKMDAFAADFCEQGEWEAIRGEVPEALAAVDARHRAGRELAHLTYHRLSIDEAEKNWAVGQLYAEVAAELEIFAATALRSRLDEPTAHALCELSSHMTGVGSASVATGAVYGIAIREGEWGFPGLMQGS